MPLLVPTKVIFTISGYRHGMNLYWLLDLDDHFYTEVVLGNFLTCPDIPPSDGFVYTSA